MAAKNKSGVNIRYLRFDPFDDGRDRDIGYRNMKIVTTLKLHKCFNQENRKLHDIPAGTQARYEVALVDGKWERHYTCIACIEKWLNSK